MDSGARKQRSITILQSHQVPSIAHLPPIEAISGAAIRPGPEIAHRAMCLSIVAELALCGRGTGAASRMRLWAIEDKLTPAEAAFLASDPPSEHDRIRMTWRYEALVPLMWAIGLIAELPFPSDTFDPGPMIDFWRTVGKDYWRGAEARPAAEILDEADLIHRLHWAVREAEISGDPPPGRLVPGVVTERHHALSWLVGHGGQPWDEVSTDG